MLDEYNLFRQDAGPDASVSETTGQAHTEPSDAKCVWACVCVCVCMFVSVQLCHS